jgi:hypothetical protein
VLCPEYASRPSLAAICHGSPVTAKLIYVEVAENLHRDVLSSPSSRQVRSTADTSVA